MTRTARFAQALGLAALALLAPPGRAQNTDTAPRTFSLQASPVFITNFDSVSGATTADLRHLGRADLIVTTSNFNTNTYTLGVRLSDGKGGYGKPALYALPDISQALAIGDFNNDGSPDVLVGLGGATAAQVFLGNGDGTLRPGPQVKLAGGTISSNTPQRFALGDFNRDGNLDFAFVARNTPGVQVFLGKGDGAFGPDRAFDDTEYYSVEDVKAADMDGDGKLDLVIARAVAGVTVLRGNGNGTFGAAKRYAVGGDSTRVDNAFVADFNRDGKPDVVCATDDAFVAANNGTFLLLGTGGGKLGTARKAAPLFVTNAADFNKDGKADIITASSGPRQVLLGKGDGTFRASDLWYGQASGETVADVNGDGRLDLIDPALGVVVTLGNGDGTFRASSTLFSGTTGESTPYAVALADFNRDGKPDMAVANAQEGTVSLFTGDGQGGFAKQHDVNIGLLPLAILATDVNGDGWPDLVVAATGDNRLTLLLGTGTGTFAAPVFLPVGQYPLALAAADVNGDGKVDLLAANAVDSTISVLLGRGSGKFDAAPALLIGKFPSEAQFPSGLAVKDVNGDGKPDIVTANQGANNVTVFLGKGGGRFALPFAFPVGRTPFAVAVGDFNHDGKPDLVTANNGEGTVSVLLGTGGGRFGRAQFYDVGVSQFTDPSAVSVGDVTGDGLPDIVVADDTDEAVTVLPGTGNGMFGTALNFFGGSGPIGLTLGDVNKDGLLDIVTANRFQGDVSVLLNTTH